MHAQQAVIRFLPVVLLAYAAVAVFWPGLAGGFLLDDAGNLRRLAQFGPAQDPESLLVALGSGTAGPTGRPVALLTLLAHDLVGAHTPWAYKFVNVLLHAANALLLYWLLRLLTRSLAGGTGPAASIAFFGAALWALHPLWVSTTLYVIQRMALLATMFSLAALILFVQGRLQVAAGAVRAGLLRMGLGLGVFGLLGLFSKETAGLLPLLMLVLEWFLFRAPAYRERFPSPPAYRVFLLFFLVVPTLLLLAWLLYRWPVGDVKSLDRWGITMLERAAIGSQMVFEYLRLLFLPTDVTQGLYYDDLQPSHWLTAPRVVASHLGIGALLGLALWLRRRFAVAAVAIVFFLAAHLLETWLVALEPGFEHRNYLPAIFLFWPLAWLLYTAPVRGFMRGRGPVLLGAALLFWLAATTIARSSLWGSPLLQAAAWVEQNPGSERAHAYLVEQLLGHGQATAALAALERGIQERPDSGVLALAGLHLSCPFGLTGTWLERVRRNVASARPRMDYYHPLMDRIVRAVARGHCPGLQLQDLLEVTQRLAAAPPVQARPVRRERLQHMRAYILLAQGRVDEAVAAYRRGMKIRPYLDGALSAATRLAEAGHPQRGLAMLDHWEALGGQVERFRPQPLARLSAGSRERLKLREYQRVRREIEAAGAGLPVQP